MEEKVLAHRSSSGISTNLKNCDHSKNSNNDVNDYLNKTVFDSHCSFKNNEIVPLSDVMNELNKLEITEGQSLLADSLYRVILHSTIVTPRVTREDFNAYIRYDYDSVTFEEFCQVMEAPVRIHRKMLYEWFYHELSNIDLFNYAADRYNSLKKAKNNEPFLEDVDMPINAQKHGYYRNGDDNLKKCIKLFKNYTKENYYYDFVENNSSCKSNNYLVKLLLFHGNIFTEFYMDTFYTSNACIIKDDDELVDYVNSRINDLHIDGNFEDSSYFKTQGVSLPLVNLVDPVLFKSILILFPHVDNKNLDDFIISRTNRCHTLFVSYMNDYDRILKSDALKDIERYHSDVLYHLIDGIFYIFPVNIQSRMLDFVLSYNGEDNFYNDLFLKLIQEEFVEKDENSIRDIFFNFFESYNNFEYESSSMGYSDVVDNFNYGLFFLSLFFTYSISDCIAIFNTLTEIIYLERFSNNNPTRKYYGVSFDKYSGYHSIYLVNNNDNGNLIFLVEPAIGFKKIDFTFNIKYFILPEDQEVSRDITISIDNIYSVFEKMINALMNRAMQKDSEKIPLTWFLEEQFLSNNDFIEEFLQLWIKIL